MPKRWSEVASSPEFQALEPDAKEAARNQYFQEVVAPNVPAEHAADARAQFDSQTAPEPGKPNGLVEFGISAAKNLPFAGGIKEIASGEGYGHDLDAYGGGKYARAAGDVATGAGMVAGALATGGVGPVLRVTGLGALANAGLEKTGLPKMLRDKSQAVMDSDRMPLNPLGFTSVKKLGGADLAKLPEWLRQPAAFAQEIPGAVQSTALDLVPTALTTLLGTKGPGALSKVATKAGYPNLGKGIVKVAGDFSGANAAKKAQIAAAAETPEALLVKNGGVRTPAMTDRTGMRGSVTRQLDNFMEVDPLSSYLPEAARRRNTGAIEKYVNENVGKGQGGDNPQQWGNNMEGVFNKAASQAKRSYGALKDELNALPWKEGVKPGEVANVALDKYMGDSGFAKAKKGGGYEFNENTTEMPREIFDAFNGLKKDLANNPPNTVAELNNKLTQFKNRNRDMIETMVNQGKRGTAEHFFGEGFGALEDVRKGVIDRAAKSAGKADFPQRMAEANTDYGDFAKGLKQHLSKFGDPNFNPEQYVDYVRSKVTGMDSANRLQRVLGPDGFSKFQDLNMKALFEAAKDYRRGNVMSLDKLKDLWNNPKKFGSIKEMFRPEQQKAVENVIKMSEKAKVTDLFDINRSGSGVVGSRTLMPYGLGALYYAGGAGIPGATAVAGLETAQQARFLAPRVSDAIHGAANRMKVPQRAGYLQQKALGVPVQPITTAAPLISQQEAKKPRLYDLYRSQP